MPDMRTYSGLFHAWRQSGPIDLGWRLFRTVSLFFRSSLKYELLTDKTGRLA